MLDSAFSARTIASSVVVPPMTAIFLPERSARRFSLDFARTRTLPPSTKMGRLKSTAFIRVSVAVVVPHSMSTRPEATAAMRSAASSGVHSTRISGRPRSFCTAVATRAQSSTL